VPLPGATSTKPFAMPIGIFLDLRPRHGGHRPLNAAKVKVGEEIEIVGSSPTQKKV